MVKSVFSKSLSFKRYMRLKIEVEKKKMVKWPKCPLTENIKEKKEGVGWGHMAIAYWLENFLDFLI